MVRTSIIALALIAAPAFAERVSKQDRKAAELSVEQSAELVEVSGTDELDPVLKFTTQAFNRKRMNDRFLRAYINKQTGARSFQIYITSSSASRARLTSITYKAGGEIERVKAEGVYFDVSCQRRTCVYYRDYVVDIPEALVRAAARDARPDIDDTWRVRGHTDHGESGDIAFLRTEAAGLLLAMGNETNRK